MARAVRLDSIVREYVPGEHLFHQGDADRGIHRVLRGTVTVYRVTADGYRQIEAFAGPGEYVSLCLSSTSPTSAQALGAVATEYVTRANFERCLLEDANFRADVFREIDKASADARRQATLLACRCAMERVAAFVLFLDGRFDVDGEGYTPIPMSRCDMADHLGLTLETVSRMLNRLKRSGVIELPRPDRFRVVSRSRICALSGDARDERCERLLAS